MSSTTVERKVRVFFCKNGKALSSQVTDILRDLDVPVDVDAAEGRKEANLNTEIAIGIWVEGTRMEADFFRELNSWETRADTEVFVCRLGGPPVDSISPGLQISIHNFDGGTPLREWLVREVLEVDETEVEGPEIDSVGAAVKHYNEEFRQRLSAEEVLNGMHGIVKKPLVEAYVPLSLVQKGGPDVLADEHIAERLFRDEGRRAFVVGVPGSGKSTLTRLLAFYMTRPVLAAENRVPFVLKAKSIADSGVHDLSERIKMSIRGMVRSAGKSTSDFIVSDDRFPASRAVVIIDGLDELDDEERAEVRRLIKAFEIVHPRCSILVTARPSAYDRSRWTDYNLYRINPLSTDQALEYVSSHGNQVTAAALRELISTSEPIRELAEVPFMLALMANYAGSAVDLPKQRAQLISQCVLAVLERRRMRSVDRLEDDQLVECLTSISYRLFKIDPTRNHAEQEFLFAIQAFLSSQLSSAVVPYQPSEAAAEILEEIIESTGLLQRTGKSIEFVHRTVWEFFVARELARNHRAELPEIALQKTWEEPIRLATGMVDGDEVEDFAAELWRVNTGLALRALSESPYPTESTITGNLGRKTDDELADLVRDLRSLLTEQSGRSGSERVALDTIKELLPRTTSAEVIWEILSTLVLIEDRVLESSRLLRGALQLENIAHRHETIVEAIGFVSCPRGSFKMGTGDASRTIDERPAHEVELSEFHISQKTLRNKDIADIPFSIGRPDSARSPSGDHPVIWVTWYEAQMAAIWFGCRLPTEAEWEYACRSGGADDVVFSSEDLIPDYAWFAENAENTTHVGGLLKKNSWGLSDMLGNVREWCSDWYMEDLYSSRNGEVIRDPIGPTAGLSKVLRGGCFDWNTANLVPTYRNSNLPANRGFQNGIRLVSGLPQDVALYLERTHETETLEGKPKL